MNRLKSFFKRLNKFCEEYFVVIYIIMVGLAYLEMTLGYVTTIKNIDETTTNSNKQLSELNEKLSDADIQVIKHHTLSDSIYSYIKEVGIKHPKIVFAQAKLESNNFTSDLFKNTNNMFGMRKAYSRPTTTKEVYKGYSSYSHWKMSIIDYALYQTYILKGSKKLTDKEYIKKISKSYAEEPEYMKRVLRIYGTL